MATKSILKEVRFKAKNCAEVLLGLLSLQKGKK